MFDRCENHVDLPIAIGVSRYLPASVPPLLIVLIELFLSTLISVRVASQGTRRMASSNASTLEDVILPIEENENSPN
jgi:hypothetical protein